MDKPCISLNFWTDRFSSFWTIWTVLREEYLKDPTLIQAHMELLQHDHFLDCNY